MRPGPRALQMLCATTVAALLWPLHTGFGLLATALLLTTITALVVEGRQLKGALLSGEREPAQTLSLGASGSIALKVHNVGAHALVGAVRQTLPDTLTETASEQGVRLGPGESTVVRFGVSASRRGSRNLNPPFARFTVHGFLEKTVEIPCAATELRIVPDVGDVRRAYEELRRFALKGFGARVAVAPGKGREFDRLRDYVPGDDMRDISWKVTARRSRLTVREFRLDRSQDIMLCVDSGLRMSARVGPLSRLDYAAKASVLLGYACQRMEDNIGALSFDSRVNPGVALGRGSGLLNRLLRFATEVEGTTLPSDYLSLAADLRARLKHRTLIVILTTLPEADSDTLLRAVKLLTPAHLPLIVALSDLSIKAIAESEAQTREELFRVIAARDIARERRETIRELRSLGARVVETAPSESAIAAMNAYLDVKKRQLL